MKNGKQSRVVVGAVTLMTVASLSGVGALPASAAPAPSAVAATSNADWHVVATAPSSMMGLAGDSAGDLVTFDTTPALRLIPVSALNAARIGQPVASGAITTLTPATYANSTGEQWIAGIVPLSGGQVLFNSGYANEIDLETSPGVYNVAFANGWLDHPTGMALDPSGSALYVVNSSGGGVYRVPVSGSTFEWASAVRVMSGLSFAMQVRVASDGTIYVADEGAYAIYSMTASQIATVMGGGAPLAPGAGLTTVASGSELKSVNGLALDANGNLYFSEYQGLQLASGGYLAVGEISASRLANGVPASLENGGIIDFADTHSVPTVDYGEQPLAVVDGILYAGSYGSDNIYAYALTPVSRVANATAVVRAGNLTATWGANGAAFYTCTLMSGFSSPSSFSVTTRTPNCTFYGVASAIFGVRIVAHSQFGAWSSAVTVFPSPYTITCVRAGRVRHVTGVDPTCPTGWRQR